MSANIYNMFNCKRCGYTCENRYLLKRHLSRKKPCAITFEDISNDELLKELDISNENKKHKCTYCDKTFTDSSNRYRHQKICKDRKTYIEILKENPCKSLQNGDLDKNCEFKKEICELKNTINNNDTINNKLKLELQYYKNRKNENFYQLLLENYIGGTHKILSCGITDITTDTCHAEIKEWPSWKEAVGQLTCYNTVDPKETIEMYMFGKYKQSCKDEAIKVTTLCKINIYEFIDTNEGISIISLENNKEVYRYKPE